MDKLSYNTLLETLIKVKLVERDLQILPNAMEIAHSSAKVAIWFFNPKTGILDYSTLAKNHGDRKQFKYQDKDVTDWISGRVFKCRDKTYTIVYISDSSYDNNFSGEMLSVLLKRLDAVVSFDYIVDQGGYNLVGKYFEDKNS